MARTNILTYEDWVRQKRGPMPVVIYDRHSSDMQDESTADMRQEGCKDYAKRQGMVVLATYADYAETGSSTMNRKQYQALLSEALSPSRRFVAIIVFHSFRWGRGDESKYDFMTLRRKGVRIISATEAMFQEEGPEGDFVRGILQEAGAYQSKQHGRYTHGLQQRNAMNGFLNGGKSPEGYAKIGIPMNIKNKRGEERYRYRLDLDQSPGPHDAGGRPRWQWVRTAMDLALKEGKGFKSIARELNALGWRQKNCDRPIGPSQVRAALTNPVYTGHVAWNRRKWFRVDGKRRSAMNAVEDWTWSKEPSHPAIVTREEYAAIARRFKVASTPMARVRRQLLAGLLECSECGSHFVINSRSKKGREYLYLICSKKQRTGWTSCPLPPIDMSVVQDAVEKLVFMRIMDPVVVRTFIKAFNERLSRRGPARAAESKAAERELDKLERELGNLAAAVAGGGTDSRVLVAEIRKREDRVQALRVQVAAAAAPREGSPLAAPVKDADVKAWARSVRGVYRAMDDDGKRAVLRHLIRKIVVNTKREGRVVFDPASLATLGQSVLGMPSDEPFRIKIGCGGWI